MKSNEEAIEALLELREKLFVYYDGVDQSKPPIIIINEYVEELGYDLPEVGEKVSQ